MASGAVPSLSSENPLRRARGSSAGSGNAARSPGCKAWMCPPMSQASAKPSSVSMSARSSLTAATPVRLLRTPLRTGTESITGGVVFLQTTAAGSGFGAAPLRPSVVSISHVARLSQGHGLPPMTSTLSSRVRYHSRDAPIEPAANDRPTPTPGVSPFLSSLPHFLPPGGGLWPRPAIGWAHEVGSVAAHQCTRSAPEINAGRTLTGSAPLEAEALASGAMPLPLG